MASVSGRHLVEAYFEVKYTEQNHRQNVPQIIHFCVQER